MVRSYGTMDPMAHVPAKSLKSARSASPAAAQPQPSLVAPRRGLLTAAKMQQSWPIFRVLLSSSFSFSGWRKVLVGDRFPREKPRACEGVPIYRAIPGSSAGCHCPTIASKSSGWGVTVMATLVFPYLLPMTRPPLQTNHGVVLVFGHLISFHLPE